MKKKKIVATVAALAMTAVTVFSVGGNYAYANADIAIQTEAVSESVTLPVSVASEAWIYSDGSREFGTWKALNIKVNDTMYPLSKDGAVNVTFSNGDEIKIYSGDSYELWEGTISISGGEVKVISQNDEYASSGCTGTTRWGCNLVYSDGTLILSKTKNFSNGGGIAFGGTSVSYKYDLTAKEKDGTPIEGVSVVQDETQVDDFSWLRAFVWYGYIKEHSEWGNGNSFDVIPGEGDNPWSFKSVVVTDKNGYSDMYLPAECKYGDYEGEYPNVYVGGSANAVLSAQGSRDAYISNGLVDVTIDDEYYTNTKTLGIEPAFAPLTGYDKVLGDYYDAKKLSEKSSNTVTLKDTTGNDIAVVTMGIKETADIHLLGKDGESYKVTGLEPVVDIKMADGVTDWTVSVTSDDNNADNTLHINAVKSGTAVSSDSYIVDLGDSQIVSADTFASILAENATKDVIIKSNNNVTFTFAKGTMASVDGKTEYDFSTSINSDYAATMPSYITKDNFVSQINYNYSGKLPATANIRFYAGTEYAGQTLYYSLMNADNTFAEVQAVVVDADGYMTVKQDHCSSYVVTKTEPKLPDNKDTKTDDGNASNNGGSADNGNGSNNGNASASDKNTSSANTKATSPNTGDMTPIAIYVVMAAAAMGVIVLVKRRKTA